MTTNGRCSAIILGAGSPYMGLTPAALRTVGESGQVLDWQLHALKTCCTDIQFIGGYNINQIAQNYPDLTYILNQEWQNTKSFGSLSKARIRPSSSYFITYSDIVFWEEDIKNISENDDRIVFAIDHSAHHDDSDDRDLEQITLNSCIQTNADTPLSGQYAFVGIVYVPQKLAETFKTHMEEARDTLSTSHLGTFIEYLDQKTDLRIAAYDISGRWSDLNKSEYLTRFLMGSKAETLSRIEKIAKHATIPAQIRFTCQEYKADKEQILHKTLEQFPNEKLAVRSSSQSEDSFSGANAGAFHSEVNIESTMEALSTAIENVIEHMPDHDGNDQVFIQPMVRDVIASGVLFTRLLHNGAPYYRVNYDIGEDTTSVTSGTAENDQTTLILKNQETVKNVPEWMSALLKAAAELETLLGIDYLDIEFAVNKQNEIFILQSRPIVLAEQPSQALDESIFLKIRMAQERFGQLTSDLPAVECKTIGFGVMPDWNPAEIIGTNPFPLSSSLYSHLIMDDIWAKQRAEFGYQDLRPAPLMHHFCGQPYVDIRASLTSFMPATLDKKFVSKYLDYTINALKKNPEWHDKVEFEILPTCYDFNYKKWDKRLSESGFLKDEISQLKAALHELTVQAIKEIDAHNDNMNLVQEHYDTIKKTKGLTPLEEALYLLDKCRELGTLNFAHMARYGFIAVILLRSAAELKILDAQRVDEFMLSVDTVSTQYQRDAYELSQGAISLDDFTNRYGHLRPGSYDPMSKRYDEDVPFYLEAAKKTATPHEENNFNWTSKETKDLEDLFKEHDLPFTVESFDRFCRIAIAGREQSKFIFTQFLSDAIQLLTQTALEFGLTREQSAFIPHSVWKNLASGLNYPNDTKAFLIGTAKHYQKEFYLSQRIELPSLLFHTDDFTCFTLGQEQPNFVTTKRVIAEVVHLDSVDHNSIALEGKIVCIQAADPGYDWLFSHKIAGLITQYGGANSHMAIRSAEFGLPAAIGVGAGKYQALASARKLHLNCETQQIIVLE